jgi:hypothetical protein
VRKDPDLCDSFFGVATDPKTGVEHQFDVIFSKRYGAAAAHDLLVRRMRAVAVQPWNFLQIPDTINRKEKGKEEVDGFEELNFPGLSWGELCGIAIGTVADKITPLHSKRGSNALPEPVAAAKKNKRKEKKEKRDRVVPHRHDLGGRVYDSRLGLTCHWCRQKTHEAHVTCTSPSCGKSEDPAKGSKLPVSFCGQCLKNRNGEDVFQASDSGKWVCPRCRGSCGPGCVSCCNCGPCRIAAGLKPTGPGISRAYAHGFGNVHDFLIGEVTEEGREAIARRKLTFPWGAWLRAKRGTQSTKTPETTPPQSPAMLPSTTTPATPTMTARLAVVPPPTQHHSCPSSVVFEVRRALDEAKAMVTEGLLAEEDYVKIKAGVLAGISFYQGQSTTGT